MLRATLVSVRDLTPDNTVTILIWPLGVSFSLTFRQEAEYDWLYCAHWNFEAVCERLGSRFRQQVEKEVDGSLLCDIRGKEVPASKEEVDILHCDTDILLSSPLSGFLDDVVQPKHFPT